MKLLNDLDILDDGRIVFTHSSSKYDRREFMRVSMDGTADGRFVLWGIQVSLFLEATNYTNKVSVWCNMI